MLRDKRCGWWRVADQEQCTGDPVLVLALHRARLASRVSRLVARRTTASLLTPQKDPATTELVEPKWRAVGARA